MKKYLHIIIVCALIAVAEHDVLAQSDGDKDTGQSLTVDHFDEITLCRTACYGICPIYKIVIRADGTAIYEGKEYVKVIGKATRRLSQEQMSELVEAINATDYFFLRDTYESIEDGCPTNWTDNPSAITSVTIAGRSKTIRHNYGCREQDTDTGTGKTYPKELTAFETRIDEVVGSVQWVGTYEERRQQRTQ